jgi:hypothetical protein
VGGVTAVAVFDYRPTPREVLERRLERGWRPMASPLRTGDRIEGYAACVFEDPALRAKVRSADADA